MSKNSAIEWCHHTFNPWWGCAKVSAGCKHCYAENLARRFGTPWGVTGVRKMQSEKYWEEPIRWNKTAHLLGERHRVFCGSMCDIFEDNPQVEVSRQRVMELARETTHLDWLFLTKRSQFAGQWLEDYHLPPHFWVGASVENQEAAEERIPHLLRIPARIRFLSCEPLLGPLDLSQYITGISWIIAGGESGVKARPMHPNWVRSLREQCLKANVPFFFKQWGQWVPSKQLDAGDYGTKGKKWDENLWSWNVGKKEAGRLLDGREWNEVPFSKQVEGFEEET